MNDHAAFLASEEHCTVVSASHDFGIITPHRHVSHGFRDLGISSYSRGPPGFGPLNNREIRRIECNAHSMSSLADDSDPVMQSAFTWTPYWVSDTTVDYTAKVSNEVQGLANVSFSFYLPLEQADFKYPLMPASGDAEFTFSI